jgi:Site-specific recombinase XerC
MPKKPDYASMFKKRGDGRYMAVVRPKDKRLKLKYLYDTDPEALYHKYQAALTPSPPTFKIAAELWQDEKWQTIRAGTQTCYSPALRRAVEENGDKLVTEITPLDINNHIKKLIAQGLSKHTISVQLAVYGLIFNFVIVSDSPELAGWLKINPTTAVKVPRGLPKKTRQAPEDNVIEIIRANTGKPFGLFPRMLINTGFRKSELCALTWGDIDFKAGTISCSKAIEYSARGEPLKPPKTEAGERSVPILPDLKLVLKRPRGAKDDDPIFPGAKGYLSKEEYTTRWSTWCIAAKLTTTTERTRKPSPAELKADKDAKPRTYQKTVPAVTAHQLRHYYATMLFEAKVDELTAMQLMGHKDRATIHEIYEHLRNKQKNTAVDALAKYQAERYSGLKSDNNLTTKAAETTQKHRKPADK